MSDLTKILLSILASFIVVILTMWLFCLPSNLFEGSSYSTVVVGKNGELLGARLADDEQWRFPPTDSLPPKFVKAIVEYEDHRFYHHGGVSLFAICRAISQNIRHGRIVSGGSTITMQVIRLHRQKDRTLWEKIVEAFMATRLETKYSKEQILSLYVSHAPFGGNVVGYRAAMWRYFGNDGNELSWAEAATLAVMQNSPSLVNLNKNREALLAKRNRLLYKLYQKGEIDEFEYQLSIDEPLIDKPFPMPQYAPHLVDYYHKQNKGCLIKTSIDLDLQKRVEDVSLYWSGRLRELGANDLAIVVVDVATGEQIAYCGNSDKGYEREGMWVDIAHSPRSSGSILKPLLYCAALQDGVILPQTLLPDVPIDFGGFAPKNFDGSYSGAVAANDALARSLNIPNIALLRDYDVAKFFNLLQSIGVLPDKQKNKYGLALISGGAEVTLADMVACYANMAKAYLSDTTAFALNDKVALYYTFSAMQEVVRPDLLDWKRVNSAARVAWKTGTSYGSRDAWAVGITPKYALGVWVGNANGSPVPSMTGISFAAPVFFNILDLLPNSGWFEQVSDSLGVVCDVCVHSGCVAGENCVDKARELLPKAALNSVPCPYCKSVTLSEDANYQILDYSEPTIQRSYFVLPPIMEHYYKQNHPEYKTLPPVKHSNRTFSDEQTMEFIYPLDGTKIGLPKKLDGQKAGVVCKVAHTNSEAEIFWYLDENYLGATRDIHQMSISPNLGRHTIKIIDSFGNDVSVSILVQ